MSGNTLKEKRLLLQIRLGQSEVFGEVYDLYVDRIYRYIYFKVATREEAEDITGETFTKAWQYLSKDNAKRIDNLSAFIYKIARNLVIDYYRQKNFRHIVAEEEVLDVIGQKESDLVERIELDMEMKAVEEALKKLKDEYRDVIILRYIDELSITEISKILDKSKGAIRVLLYRAIRALREVMGVDVEADKRWWRADQTLMRFKLSRFKERSISVNLRYNPRKSASK